ncbi:hypothetical protein E3N88_40672 [Mikania micrantha]|uniref:Uncharacterized protein n=1 Tax=Mikania micrantha TaxID=192012 RepID=A0A5N6LND8_9ASTR|nr:hypothetical protein E3N88_40672 [Mikania micrantha]
MSNIAKLEFPALNISGENYMAWTAHVKRHLKSMGVLETINVNNNCLEQEKAKADAFLHKHIDGMLQFEYSNCDDPFALWKDLQEIFNHQKAVLLPAARDEWSNLRLQDFKKVNDYTSALFRICSILRFCGQNVTEEDMLEKTFSTFHASNAALQTYLRVQGFKRYSDLNALLLVAEKNNEVLMKNHLARPTGSLALPEANAISNNDVKIFRQKNARGRGRGRGRFDKIISTIHLNGTTIITVEVVVVAKELVPTTPYKMTTNNISFKMKLVRLKTMTVHVLDVEVKIIGQKLVARHLIYASYIKHLLKKKRKKLTMWTNSMMRTLS